MIGRCVDCGQDTPWLDYHDFNMRCDQHLVGDGANIEDEDIPLTQRELQVALFCADGLTNHQLGEELNLSTGYVRNIVSRVIKKLGVEDRRAINRRLREYGL